MYNCACVQHVAKFNDGDAAGANAFRQWLCNLAPQLNNRLKYTRGDNSPATSVLHDRQCPVCRDKFGSDQPRHVIVPSECDHVMHPVCYLRAVRGMLADGWLATPCAACGIVVQDVVSVPIREVSLESPEARRAVMKQVIKRRSQPQQLCPNLDAAGPPCWRDIAGLPCEYSHSSEAQPKRTWNQLLGRCAGAFGAKAEKDLAKLPHKYQLVAWRVLMEFGWDH